MEKVEQQDEKDKFSVLKEFDLILDEDLLQETLEDNELNFTGVIDGRKHNVDSVFDFQFLKSDTEDPMHNVGIGIKYIPEMDLNKVLDKRIKQKESQFIE